MGISLNQLKNMINKIMSKINSQLDEKTKLLNARMDTFTKLEEGSTTADAELADGRVATDGIVYENIGGAIRGQVGKLKETLDDEIKNGGSLVYDKTFTLSQGSISLDDMAVQNMFVNGDILKVVVSCSNNPTDILDIYSYVIYTDESAPRLVFTDSSYTIFTAKKDISRISLRTGSDNTFTGDVNIKIYKTCFRQIVSDYTSNNGIVIEKHIPKLKKDNFYLLTMPKGGDYFFELSNYNRSDKCIVKFLDYKRKLVYEITNNAIEDKYFFKLTDEQCEEIQYIMIQFWTDSDSLNFSLRYGVNATISKNIKKLYSQRLIGAVFFDGWRGKWDNSTYSTESQSLYEKSSIYDSLYPDWREKYYNIYGHYPCEQMSFSISFPEEIAKLTNSNGEYYPNLPSRKPIESYEDVLLGWINTATQEQIEAQIDMAYNYGVDYWAIVTGFSPKYFVEGEFQEEAWFNNNPSIKAIMNASNKYKIRFCLINTFSPKSETGKENVQMRKFIEEKIMSDSQYLYVDGKPVLIEYVCDANSDTDGIFEPYCHLRNMSIISTGYRGFGIDGMASYSGYVKYISSESYYQEEYEILSDYNLDNTKKNFTENKGVLILPVSAGRSLSARSDFSTHVDYKAPTKEELKIAITEMIDYSESLKINDKVIMIYAWNEFCEGGWLMPTQNEIDSGDGFYRLEALQEAKTYWKSIVS